MLTILKIVFGESYSAPLPLPGRGFPEAGPKIVQEKVSHAALLFSVHVTPRATAHHLSSWSRKHFSPSHLSLDLVFWFVSVFVLDQLSLQLLVCC